MKILLDTNAYTFMRMGDREIQDAVRKASSVWLSVVVVGELQSGFKKGSREKQNLDSLADFIAEPETRVADLTIETAAHYAQIDNLLRKKGRPLPRNDVWIAASVLEHGCFLVTRDQHFDELEFLPRVPLNS